MNWQTIQSLGKPTDKQIQAYCKKHNIDYDLVFNQYADFETMQKVLDELYAINLTKHSDFFNFCINYSL